MIFGLNIDHIATIRNARRSDYPNLLHACEISARSGVKIITIHLREDRRHINDEDAKLICESKILPINLEIAPTDEMIDIAIKLKPTFVCLVPEKREEITTEGGLNLELNHKNIEKCITRLKEHNIQVSCFVDPCPKTIEIANNIKTDIVELHTGRFALNESMEDFNSIKQCASFASDLGLKVHAGHGLTYSSVEKIVQIKEISALHIGHFVITDSIFIGLENSIKKMLNIINTVK